MFGVVINDIIEQEKAGKAFEFLGDDHKVLDELCQEINSTLSLNYEIHYMTLIYMWQIAGVGNIGVKYIERFESESLRACLVRPIVFDKVDGRDRLIMDLYHHYRASKRYISLNGYAPAQIVVSYDNAFAKMQSKKIMPELVEISRSLRDLFYLPYTFKMIARKWAPPELEKIMQEHLINTPQSKADIGYPEEGECWPSFDALVEQTRFNAIACLQYYPSERNIEIISSYCNHDCKELRKFADKTAKAMREKLEKS